MFILTLPFVTPRIDWDGTGYYGYLRSVMFDHNLQFKGDWASNGKASAVPLGKVGLPHGIPITKTGHLANYLAVGPAMLWAPFVIATRAVMIVLHGSSASAPADGHGPPYVRAVCYASALYAFLGLWISFKFARSLVEEKWALLATIAIWFASPLPLYMYSDPSWAHADCVFVVALFLWYWKRTRDSATETHRQWAIWGLISGLMCDVYFPNGVFLLLPALELFLDLRKGEDRIGAFKTTLLRGFAFAGAFVIAFLPTMIVRQIIFGSPFSTGAYGSQPWNWTSPKFLSVLFSPSHGAFTTTPLLIIAVAGLFLLWRRQPSIGGRLVLLTVGFWTLIAVYPWWNGLVSFGSRFFVSLTPIFVIGLAVAFERFTAVWKDSRPAMRRAVAISALLIIWNLGLICQLDHGLFMQIGPVDWQNALYNEFRTVPGIVVSEVAAKISPAPHTALTEQARSN
ncbi:MAG: hypothetical protein ACRD4R_09800 [Candidatus Acidiferrales bacterium]